MTIERYIEIMMSLAVTCLAIGALLVVIYSLRGLI